MAEFVYTLLILSGMIKFFIILNAPALGIVDFTLLTSSILTVILLGSTFKNFFFKNKFYVAKGSFSALFLLSAFFCWMVFSLIYSQSTVYGPTKTYLFMTSILAFIFPLLYKDFDPKKFFRYFVICGTVFLLLYIAIMPETYAYTSEEEKQFIGKYLDVGYLAALNLLILMFIKLDFRPSIKTTLIGTNLMNTMLAGARGPIVNLVLVMILVVFVKSRHWLVYLKNIGFKKVVAFLLALVILTGGLVYAAQAYPESVDRTLYRLSLLLDAGSNSVSARISYILFSLEKIFEDAGRVFIGYGIGSFGILYDGEDKRLFPHNIVLETWFELGIIGLILISLFFFLCLRRIKGSGGFFVFMYLFFNAFQSFSLPDLRIMFGIMSVLWVWAIWEKIEENTGSKSGNIL